MHSTQTARTAPPAEIEPRTAVFVARGFDFDRLDFAVLDVYAYPPGGGPNTVDERRFTAGVTEIAIELPASQPPLESLTYALTWVFDDGRRLSTRPVEVQALSTVEPVVVEWPFVERALGFRLINAPESDVFLVEAALSARYVDQLYPLALDLHSWDLRIGPEPGVVASSTWTTEVLADTSASYVEYRGRLVLSDGSERPISAFKTSRSQASFSNVEVPASVEVDPRRIAFQDGIEAVQVDLFTRAGGSEPAQYQTLVFKPLTGASGKTLPPPSQLAEFVHPPSVPFDYEFEATYYLSDGTERPLARTLTRARLLLLPARA